MQNSKILKGVNSYYSNKLKENGDNARGVDWNSKESQYLRFQQLSKIIKNTSFSILDFGCGTGEYINFLSDNNFDFQYSGFDISKEMIEKGIEKFSKLENVNFLNSLEKETFDYAIASGLFNVKLDFASNKEWFEYIVETLELLNDKSTFGFSFNALTKYSDDDFKKDYLYYADPLLLFDYCKKKFSRNVALFHDYKLFEFSILVRK